MLMWIGCSFLHTDSAVLTDSASVTDYTFQNVYIAGKTGKSNVRIQNGRITEIETSETTQTPNIWMVPAFIDSHVHFAYLPRSEEMLDGGIAAAVDLAACVRMPRGLAEPLPSAAPLHRNPQILGNLCFTSGVTVFLDILEFGL